MFEGFFTELFFNVYVISNPVGKIATKQSEGVRFC